MRGGQALEKGRGVSCALAVDTFPLNGCHVGMNYASKPESSAIALDQGRLDIVERTRTSRLPWRGQFSPELVEYLLDTVCPGSTCVFDPFCGSGTVLYEALRQGKSAIGSEVNPAAWHMAALANFTNCHSDERTETIQDLRRISARHSNSFATSEQLSHDVLDYINNSQAPFFRLALSAAIILGMKNSNEITSTALARGCVAVTGILSELESRISSASCLLSDARNISLQDESVDAVITSPPYVNVFNYHQNYRPAVELLGWQPLEAAKSEIGANRKFRQNRFLTVAQYCLDMQQSLNESARVLCEGAPLVIVLGRTSSVLGTSFANGRSMEELIGCSGRLELVSKAERVFTSRYGVWIYEDILVARKSGKGRPDERRARRIARAALLGGVTSVPEKNRGALLDAIERTDTIEASPLLSLTIPPAYLSYKLDRKTA